MDPATDPNNLTAALWMPGAEPADLATLRADPAFGDGNMQTGTFGPWTYVILRDGTQTFYDDLAAVWVVGAAPPVGPYSGTVIADLATLRATLSSQQSTIDDPNLERALASASEWVYERTMHCDWDHPDVQYAILLLAGRLYQRRKSPEGVAGFGGEGAVVRVLATDPDIRSLMERHLEMLDAGIG